MLFHKINYLDLRKIEYFLEEYINLNPFFCSKHLFILSSLYLVEVGFDQDSCGVRISKEKGKYIEYPVFKRENCYQNFNDLCYTYNIDDFIRNRVYNKKKKAFLKDKDYNIKVLKKEDFKDVLLFVQEYYESIGKLNEKEYFDMLIKLKFSFEHLYELEIDAVAIFKKDKLLGFYLAYNYNSYYIIEALLPFKEIEIPLFDKALIMAAKNKKNVVLFKKIEEIINI